MSERILATIAKMVAVGASVLGPETDIHRVRILWHHRLNKLNSQLEKEDLSEVNSKDIILTMVHLGAMYLYKRKKETMAKVSLDGIIALVDYFSSKGES